MITFCGGSMPKNAIFIISAPLKKKQKTQGADILQEYYKYFLCNLYADVHQNLRSGWGLGTVMIWHGIFHICIASNITRHSGKN
jgi:hypothetical protein